MAVSSEWFSVVSLVATNLKVRAELVRRQQRIVADLSTPPAPGVVAEGRDITTVVAPQAHVRVLLTADEDARLSRRAAEMHGHLAVDPDALDHAPPEQAALGPSALAATRDQVLRRDADHHSEPGPR